MTSRRTDGAKNAYPKDTRDKFQYKSVKTMPEASGSIFVVPIISSRQ